MKRPLTPSPAMIVAVIALAVALSGSAVAAGLIRGGQIANHTITGSKLKNGTVGPAQIRPNSLTGGQVRNGRLTGADIRNGSIGPADLAPGLLSAGPRGAQGLQGAKGDPGPQGPMGPSRALAAGSSAGGEVATAATPAPIGRMASTPVTLTIVHSSTAAGPATVACGDSVTQPSSWRDLKVTTVAVGAIATLPLGP